MWLLKAKGSQSRFFLMKSKRMNAAILAGFPCSHRKLILHYNPRVSSLQISFCHYILYHPFGWQPGLFNYSFYFIHFHWFLNTFQQALFNDQSLESSEKIIATTQTAIFQEETEAFEKPHTLQEYSIDHFLPPPKRTLSKALQSQVKRRDKNIPWTFTKVMSVCTRFTHLWEFISYQRFNKVVINNCEMLGLVAFCCDAFCRHNFECNRQRISGFGEFKVKSTKSTYKTFELMLTWENNQHK